jgi:hypothetical protein
MAFFLIEEDVDFVDQEVNFVLCNIKISYGVHLQNSLKLADAIDATGATGAIDATDANSFLIHSEFRRR